LLEPQRTNFLAYSQDLSNADWQVITNGGPVTKTANAGTAPDGTNTASRVQITGGGAYTVVAQSGVNPLGIVTISGYFKRYGATDQAFRFFVNNGDVTANLTATDTWQRFSFTVNASSTGADGLANDTSNNPCDILVWGMQLESGAYATSYIPTTTAAVTRLADSCSKTGISSLIGQTEGTLFIDVNLDTVSAQTNDPVLIYLRGTNVETYIEIIDNGGVSSLHFNSGVQAVIDAPAGSLTAGRNKFAFTYKQNDFALYLNGVLMGTDTSGTVGAQGEFGFQYHNSAFEGQQKVNQALLFKTRLTNAQLAELTSL
jgi:hypothetical protein